MKKRLRVSVLVLVLAAGFAAQAKTVRVSETNPAELAKLMESNPVDLTLEFRQGDVIPLHLAAQGDLFETASAGVTNLNVKRNFWIRIQGSNIGMSLDGSVFRPIPEVLGGSISAGASADPNNGSVSAIDLILSTHLK